VYHFILQPAFSNVEKGVCELRILFQSYFEITNSQFMVAHHLVHDATLIIDHFVVGVFQLDFGKLAEGVLVAVHSAEHEALVENG